MNIIFMVIAGILGWLIASIAYIDGYEVKGGLKKNFVKYLQPKDLRWTILTLISIVLSGYFANILYANGFDSYAPIIFCCYLVLLHAALVDLICYQIVIGPLLVAIGILMIVNLILIIGWGIEYQQFGYYPKENLIGAGAAALLFFMIIKLTKGKGMGEGDLLIFVLMALTLGIGKLIVAFYVMIFAGCIYGVIVGLIKGKIRGIKMPFVPFMFLGFLVAAIFGQIVISFYLQNFLLI